MDTQTKIPDVVGTRCPTCNKGTIMIEAVPEPLSQFPANEHKLWCEQFHNWITVLP